MSIMIIMNALRVITLNPKTRCREQVEDLNVNTVKGYHKFKSNL